MKKVIAFLLTCVLLSGSTVITRAATWDNDRIGSLVIISENGEGNVRDVTFKNIDIGYDFGRPINLCVKNKDRTGMVMENIRFENISWTADAAAQLKAGNAQNHISAQLSGILAAIGEQPPVPITEENLPNFFLCDETSNIKIRD